MNNFFRAKSSLLSKKDRTRAAIIDSAIRTGLVVTAEEHQRLGGLGGSVAQVLAENHPTPMSMVAVDDSFGESGTPKQLMEKYGLTADAIVARSLELIAQKNNISAH